MSFSVFILYAVPALFIAYIGYEIPMLEIDDKFKYLIYSIAVLITFVFKFYADYAFKASDRRKGKVEIENRDKKIDALEKQVNELEYNMRIRELNHTEAYLRIEKKLSLHLKTNSKCKENEALWSGVEGVSEEITELTVRSIRVSGRTNRKKQ